MNFVFLDEGCTINIKKYMVFLERLNVELAEKGYIYRSTKSFLSDDIQTEIYEIDSKATNCFYMHRIRQILIH